MPKDIYGDLKLENELCQLLDQLKKLHAHIREYRWDKYKRCDPFVETLFERTEKASFLGIDQVVLHDSVICNGDITIGKHTHVGQQCTLDGSGGLSIGSHCSIAPGVRILTHDSAKKALTNGAHAIERSSVSIGDCCFIGANSVITRGVTIGNHSVVGAGAVVVKDVPPKTIVGGIPAKHLGRIVIENDTVHYVYD